MHTIQLIRNNSTAIQSGTTLVDPTVRFVSATSLDADGEVRGIVRPKVPNYAVRRSVVGVGAAVAICLLALGSVGLLAGLGSSSVVASDIASSGAPTAHVAETGDTMWSVASDYRGEVSHGRYLDALIQRNGGTELRVGQVIWLP